MRITVTSNWHLTINLLACVIFDPGHCGEVCMMSIASVLCV